MHEFKEEYYFEQLNKYMTKTTERLSAYVQDPNEKNVHDVRTSIRRLDAAFKILPKKIRKKAKLRKFMLEIKKFFKTNNQIRDFDIISQKLISMQSEESKIKIDLDRDFSSHIDPPYSLSSKDERDLDRKSTRLNSSHGTLSRMPSSA